MESSSPAKTTWRKGESMHLGIPAVLAHGLYFSFSNTGSCYVGQANFKLVVIPHLHFPSSNVTSVCYHQLSLYLYIHTFLHRILAFALSDVSHWSMLMVWLKNVSLLFGNWEHSGCRGAMFLKSCSISYTENIHELYLNPLHPEHYRTVGTDRSISREHFLSCFDLCIKVNS